MGGNGAIGGVGAVTEIGHPSVLEFGFDVCVHELFPFVTGAPGVPALATPEPIENTATDVAMLTAILVERFIAVPFGWPPHNLCIGRPRAYLSRRDDAFVIVERFADALSADVINNRALFVLRPQNWRYISNAARVHNRWKKIVK